MRHDDEAGQPGAKARASRGIAAVCGLDDAVRRSLYDYVSDSGRPVGRDEAAEATGIGRALAAYHLDKLVGFGLLTAGYQRIGRKRGPGAGRPAKVYARSQAEFAVTLPPRKYQLAASLLVRGVEADPSGSALAGLKLAAREHGAALGRAARTAEAGRSSDISATRAALAAQGFEPLADERGGLSVRNCPFHQLAMRNPSVVCAMSLALIEGIVAGIGASHHLRAQLDPGPDRCCVVVRAPAADPLERHDS